MPPPEFDQVAAAHMVWATIRNHIRDTSELCELNNPGPRGLLANAIVQTSVADVFTREICTPGKPILRLSAKIR